MFPRETGSGVGAQLPILGAESPSPSHCLVPFCFLRASAGGDLGWERGLTPKPLAFPPDGRLTFARRLYLRGWGPPSGSATGRRQTPLCTPHCPHHICPPHTASRAGGWGCRRRPPFVSPRLVCVPRAALASAHQCHPLPQTLSVLKSTPQVRGMHTIIR